MCWLLLNLAVFALPFFACVTIGTWAYGAGAGWLGATFIGLAGAGLVLTLGQGLLMVNRHRQWRRPRRSAAAGSPRS